MNVFLVVCARMLSDLKRRIVAKERVTFTACRRLSSAEEHLG